MRDHGSLNRATTTDKVVENAALEGVADAQRRLMAEPVILVNGRDEPVGQVSKLQAHRTADGLPLHRAFSVFLYDAADRLLLQRRAASKVTFPLYWTNTCCSHPLYTDAERNPAGSAVLGAQRAAVRKLQQELGITGAAPEEFTYLTRIHYRAEGRREHRGVAGGAQPRRGRRRPLGDTDRVAGAAGRSGRARHPVVPPHRRAVLVRVVAALGPGARPAAAALRSRAHSPAG
eukprot:ctg_1754.g520